jgi:nuclear protein localization protein 4 homolog
MEHLPSTVDPNTISVSPDPKGEDSKKLRDLAKFKLGQIGLK